MPDCREIQHPDSATVPVDSTCLRFYSAPCLDAAQQRSWRAFADTVPWAHYLQDPAWAEVERRGIGGNARAPQFFWAVAGEEILLTAMGVCRRLLVPGRVFWEFNHGPLFRDAGVFDAWLDWLDEWLGRSAARLRVQPAMPLDAGGDDLETLLERHEFARRRKLGGWTTLSVELAADERDTFATFRSATQRAIKKSGRLGIAVTSDDTVTGGSILARMQTELARQAPVEVTDQAYVTRVRDSWLAGGRGGTILVARHRDEPVAAGLVVVYGKTAYLPLIPSSRQHRDLPASHLLVWEAIRWARQHGCLTFDLVGYSMTACPGDSLWGINQFKRGFASLDRLSKFVAVHERVAGPRVVAAAAHVRRAQAWTRRVRSEAR
jgi:hypothetical protein